MIGCTVQLNLERFLFSSDKSVQLASWILIFWRYISRYQLSFGADDVNFMNVALGYVSNKHNQWFYCVFWAASQSGH